MGSIRPHLLAATCTLPLFFVACGGSDSEGDTQPVPEGTHYGYVVNKVYVPPSMQKAVTSEFGLDLGQTKSSSLDNRIDNQLGGALSSLSMYFDVQKSLDTAISKGSIILLVDFQTKDFTNTAAAGLSVKLGANPVPAACTSATDTTCGHHLTGSASFSIAADSPTDALVSGKIVNGAFNGGPGDIPLQIALGTAEPITLSLLKARAKTAALTDSTMTAVVGGVLTLSELNSQVIPAIQVQVASVLTDECGATRTPPTCGCAAGSTGETILNLFEGTTKDCNISVDEIANSALTKSLLGPDICSSKSCTAPDALSIGIKVDAVKATFPM